MEYDFKSPHYSIGGIECIDYIKAKLSTDEFRGYLKGNILKYASRNKDPERDIEKLTFYANWLSEHLQRSKGA